MRTTLSPAELRKLTAIEARINRPRPGSGHVYIAEFWSGVVKVGKAVDPKRRLARHNETANIHGDGLVNAMVSGRRQDFAEIEQELIKFCVGRGQLAGGHEWFRGVSYDEVRDFATSLTGTGDDDSEPEQAE